MNTEPDLDELLVRHHLRDLGVGHTPTGQEDDWWAALYPDDDAEPDASDTVPEVTPDDARPMLGRFRKPFERLPDWRSGQTADLGEHDTNGGADTDEDDPDADPEWEDAAPDDESTPAAVKRSKQRQQVTATWVGLPARTRWLASTGAGAGCGWVLGLGSAMCGWIGDCGHDEGVTTALILGGGLVAASAYAAHRTRAWWPPLAWCCRIPFATALLALCLYAPGVTP